MSNNHLDANYYFLLEQLHSDAEQKRSELTELKSELSLKQKTVNNSLEQQSRLQLHMIGQRKHVELLETRCGNLSVRCSELSSLVDKYSRALESTQSEQQAKKDMIDKKKEVENLQHVLNLQNFSMRSGRPMERCEERKRSDYGLLKKQLQLVNVRLQTKTDLCAELDRRLNEAIALNTQYRQLLAKKDETFSMNPERETCLGSLDSIDEDHNNPSSDYEKESMTSLFHQPVPKRTPVVNNLGYILDNSSPGSFFVRLPPQDDAQISGFESALNLIETSPSDLNRRLGVMDCPKQLLSSDICVPMIGGRSLLERSISDRVQAIRKKYRHDKIEKNL